ncbi:MAG: flavodoxin domain-containing protein [Chloroflexi bacterium]|nr:flavodoxin domain-containing protein [Chloroflexota bacterium]
MDTKILVAYASKHGMTEEIANKIGETLRQSGFQVDVLPVKRVIKPETFKAVVLGSAFYIAMWRKDMVKFLEKNEKLLSERPVWLFSSGPMGEGDPAELSQGWRFPEAQRSMIERIKPRDVTIFHGAINIKKMSFLEKWVLKNVKAPTGDFRDWDAINKWAGSVAAALKR